MKKKLLAVLLTGTMTVAALSGCGNSNSGTEEANADTTRTEETDAVKEQDGSADAQAEGEEESASSTVSDSIVSGPTELTYIFADGDEGAKASMNELVNKFNETYENITVTIEPGNGGAYSEFLKTKDSVGEFPDIMEMRDTAMYVRAGKLAPLPEDIASLFMTTTEFGGQVYTAPFGGENTNGIIYNKKYFDENGWKEPTTYDEFIELCQAIADKGDMAPLVVGGQDIWHMGFWFHKAYNDQVLSKDADFIKHCYEGTKELC